MVDIPQKSREDIVRGALTDNARTLGHLHDLEMEVVTRILREIADDLVEKT